MNTDNIETIFAEYLTTKNTQHAILLNGAWGCGKTYFWKQNLVKVAETNKFKTIYVSLNGISKAESLEHILFIKLLPFVGNKDNKLAKNTTKLITNVANQVSKKLLKATLTDIFKGVSMDTFNFSRHVICFDDLERCQMPMKEVLGFINNFVEHKKLKTVILADETNIDSTEKGYNNIKEKVIGRVINFELDINKILPQLFENHKGEQIEFYNFLSDKQDKITAILTEYKQNNLRIISFYLDVLKKIFPSIKEINEQYIEEILVFSAIITIEFKTGGLKSADFKNPNGVEQIGKSRFKYNLSKKEHESKEGKSIEKSYPEMLYEKYLTNGINEYFYYQSIYSYILSGYLDFAKLDDEVKKRNPEEIPKETRDYEALLSYEFRGLSNNEFSELIASVTAYAKEGKYSIYDYSSIAKSFYFFSDNGLIKQTIEDINLLVHQGLDAAKNSCEIDKWALDNLLHFEDDDPQVTEVKHKIKQTHSDIEKEGYIKNGKELIEALLSQDTLALEKIFKKDRIIGNSLRYIDGKMLFEALVSSGNKSIFGFTELIKERYNLIDFGRFYSDDYGALSSLNKYIRKYMVDEKPSGQPFVFLLDELNKLLERACKELIKEIKN